MGIAQYNIYGGLTSCKAASTANVSGTYQNGPLYNGVGATITLPFSGGDLVVDSIFIGYGERVLLRAQTNLYENGIYILTQSPTLSIPGILTRTQDFNSPSLIFEGRYVPVSSGSRNTGVIYTVIEPIPQNIGVDSINFTVPETFATAAFKDATNNEQPNIASVKGSITASHIPVFADTAGTIQDGGVLGTATPKSVSDNTKSTISSVSGTTVINNIVVAADTAGTIKDGGAHIISGQYQTGGGFPFIVIPAPGVTPSSIVNAMVSAVLAGNPSTVLIRVVPGTNQLTIFVSADPGVSTINYTSVSAPLV